MAQRLRAVTVPRLLLALFLLGYAALGAAALDGQMGWGDDWAQYLLHARAIAGLRPYADTGYLFNPDAPNIGPPVYPPGLPLLLAPFVALFGIDFAILKLVCFACTVAALPLAFRVLARPFGEGIALVAVVLFALHPDVLALNNDIVAEAPYLLFSLLALWWGSRAGPRPAGIGGGVVLGLLVYAALACRSIGVALVPAAIAFGWAQRRPPRWFLGFAVSLAVLVAVQTALLARPATYAGSLSFPTFSSLGEAAHFWAALGRIFRLPWERDYGLGQVSRALDVAVVALALLGAWSLCRQPAMSAAPSRPGLRDRAARVPLLVWYVAGYVAVLVLSGEVGLDRRYILPVLPLVIALAAAGLRFLLPALGDPRRGAFPLLALIAADYAGMHLSAPPRGPEKLATCDGCREMFAFIRDHIAADAIVAFANPRAMALLGQRASWRWSLDYSAAELRAKLRAVGAGVLVVPRPGPTLAEYYPAAMDFAGFARAPGTRVLFENRDFAVLGLAAPPGG